jgi:hypothetical protein
MIRVEVYIRGSAVSWLWAHLEIGRSLTSPKLRFKWENDKFFLQRGAGARRAEPRPVTLPAGPGPPSGRPSPTRGGFQSWTKRHKVEDFLIGGRRGEPRPTTRPAGPFPPDGRPSPRRGACRTDPMIRVELYIRGSVVVSWRTLNFSLQSLPRWPDAQPGCPSTHPSPLASKRYMSRRKEKGQDLLKGGEGGSLGRRSGRRVPFPRAAALL